MWRRALALVVILACAGTAGAAVPTITHEGRAYVELPRLADHLHATVEATASSVQARMRVGDRQVTFTRNWSRILVDGEPIVLNAPVVVKRGTWLVPASFLAQVVPRLTVATAAGRAPAVRPVPASIADVRFRSYPSFTRIVVETSKPVSYTIEASAGKEARVRLISIRGDARALEIGDGLVAEARMERAAPDLVLRVGLDAALGELRPSTFTDPDRLVLDFYRPVEPRPAGSESVRRIVLDAGHGGHDPGATGPTGLMEKDVVLDVTRRVARLVEDKLGIKVLLTRDGDHFVPLKDRTGFANRERADLFVSIHANAHRELVHEGVETYFLSSEATDSSARQLAEMENSVIHLERGPAGRGREAVLRTIFSDLGQSRFQQESSRLAEVVQDAMTESLSIPSRGVKQAGFYVLSAAMPAVLVEIGFVTNPREERRLRETSYRDEIARAIFSGLADYKRAGDQRGRAAVR
jgi:N-acetylmuramoyl-L-alanine amidase